MAGFGDRVIERTRTLGHPLCVGLDPYLDRIPSLFRRGGMRGFRRGPAGLEGGIVSSSRPILFPTAFSDAGADSWEKQVRNALARTADELGEAVR